MATEGIVIIGAGPAGAAAAIGLARMGEPVVLVGEPRRFAAVEGTSVRVIDALRGLGLRQALQALAPPSPRRAVWNGRYTEANQESLVDRERFDRGLLDDLERLGVKLVRGRVTALHSAPGLHELEIDTDAGRRTLAADFLVEARGRAAPGGGAPRLRGVETVSLLQYWRGPAGEAGSAVTGVEDGWMWMAALADGRRYLQLTIDVASASLPPKRALGDYCSARFRAVEAATPFLRDAEPVGEPYARTSTAVLNEVVAGDDWIRVGDAAMAVDPLSGNGIFQALSSALQAPAVVATLRHDPHRAALARQFHSRRIEHLFHRFARIGRDFYAQELRWPQAPFWAARRGWPDAQPLHATVTPETVRVARGPVVCEGRIVEADVVVTPDQPLGVWQVDGLAVAPILAALRAEEGSARDKVRGEAVLCARFGLEPARAAGLLAWMRAQNWLI
ncbi:lycopene cyclase family protein [Thauera humireducens]|uniref:FAD-dependent oxidoreductase n=1 Tax=Thauera humireducens TaxID=1134435 RepID=A0A127K975_9RHOO|nr:lycopene cyclase family protein [Thauera humireducens]AMO38520.1 FAD-dependent oxidoreductase [Thauera humireducens]